MGAGRVGSGRVGSDFLSAIAGRVVSKKRDPWTTLMHLGPSSYSPYYLERSFLLQIRTVPRKWSGISLKLNFLILFF